MGRWRCCVAHAGGTEGNREPKVERKEGHDPLTTDFFFILKHEKVLSPYKSIKVSKAHGMVAHAPFSACSSLFLLNSIGEINMRAFFCRFSSLRSESRSIVAHQAGLTLSSHNQHARLPNDLWLIFSWRVCACTTLDILNKKNYVDGWRWRTQSTAKKEWKKEKTNVGDRKQKYAKTLPLSSENSDPNKKLQSPAKILTGSVQEP